MDSELTEATLTEDVEGELTTEIRGINAGDWNLIAAAALIGGLVVGLRNWTTSTVGVAGVCAASVLLVSLLYLNDPVRVFDEPFRSAARPLISAGTGVYVALVGGVLQAGGTLWAYQRRWFSSGRYGHVVSALFGSVSGSLQRPERSAEQTVATQRDTSRDRQVRDRDRHAQTQSGSRDRSRQRSADTDALVEAYVRSSVSPDGKWVVDMPVGFSVHDDESSTPVEPIDAVCLTSQDPALPETYPDGPQHFLEPMEYQPTVTKTDIFRRMHNVGSLSGETVSIVELEAGTPTFEAIGKLEAYRTLLETEYEMTVAEQILISTERDPVVDRVCRKTGIRVVNAG